MGDFPGPDLPPAPPERPSRQSTWEVRWSWRAFAAAVVLVVALNSLEWWRVALVWGALYVFREEWRRG